MRPFIFQLPEWLPGPLSGRPIFSYGVMLGISFLLSWYIVLYLVEKNGMDKKKASNAIFTAMICSLIGARLFYFFTDLDNFTVKNFFKFTEGGLVAYGGYIGGILGAYVHCLIRSFNFWNLADMTAPQLALGLGITRFGCFLYGCDYGKVTDSPVSLLYPRWDMPGLSSWITSHSPAYNDHLSQKLISLKDSVHSLPVLPMQLMESLSGFIIFSVLFLYLPFRKFKGQILFLFLIIYGIDRFILEYFRGDADRGENVFGTPFSSSQFISIVLIIISVILWIPFSKKYKIEKINK
jgi:phosphatidylglycerol:prolipoprotein diacylglycerol transferase